MVAAQSVISSSPSMYYASENKRLRKYYSDIIKTQKNIERDERANKKALEEQKYKDLFNLQKQTAIRLERDERVPSTAPNLTLPDIFKRNQDLEQIKQTLTKTLVPSQSYTPEHPASSKGQISMDELKKAVAKPNLRHTPPKQPVEKPVSRMQTEIETKAAAIGLGRVPTKHPPELTSEEKQKSPIILPKHKEASTPSLIQYRDKAIKVRDEYKTLFKTKPQKKTMTSDRNLTNTKINAMDIPALQAYLEEMKKFGQLNMNQNLINLAGSGLRKKSPLRYTTIRRNALGQFIKA